MLTVSFTHVGCVCGNDCNWTVSLSVTSGVELASVSVKWALPGPWPLASSWVGFVHFRISIRRVAVGDKSGSSSSDKRLTGVIQTARLGFEALTGGRDMAKALVPVYFMRGTSSSSSSSSSGNGNSSMLPMPAGTDQPSVTYVSLTGDANDMLSDSSGHRVLVLQCHGHVRVIQASKGAAYG